jgi:hypothetical protein
VVWYFWPLQPQNLYIWLNNTVSGLLTLDLILELYLLLLSNSIDINLTANNNMTQTSVDTAFDNMKQAESAGADVSNLVERFNDALELLHQAQISGFNKSCSSYTNCIADAQEIFSQITNESASYREHAGRDFYYNVFGIFALYAPLGAFLISFFGLYSYKSWKSYQIKKFLDLEIREIGN